MTTVPMIMATEDGQINPFSRAFWTPGFKTLLKSRRALPVIQQFKKILDAKQKNQVFVLTSDPGSGKSTQIPHMLAYDEYRSYLRIACTQPHELAATQLAACAADEMGVTLGEEVGYQVYGDCNIDQKNKHTLVSYMTEGVLLGKATFDKTLEEYACVVIDEAHQRTIYTDVLLALLKKALARRRDLKVISILSLYVSVDFISNAR